MPRPVRFLVWKHRAKGPPVPYWQPVGALKAAFPARALRQPDGAPMTEAEAVAEVAALLVKAEAWARGAPDMAPVPPPSAPWTLSRLVAAFRAGPMRALAPATARQYAAAFGALETLMGDRPVASLTRERAAAIAGGARTPAMQRATLAGLRRLMSFGLDRGIVRAHPFTGDTRIRIEGGVSARIRIWSRAEIDRMLAAADALGLASIGDAILLGLWHGQRQADRLAMVWPRAGAEQIRIAQQKMKRFGRVVTLPIGADAGPVLAARIASMRARALASAETRGLALLTLEGRPMIVSETTGGPYKGDHYRHAFARVREAAAFFHMLELLGHLVTRANGPAPAACEWTEVVDRDLRDTCVSLLYEAGCSIEDICSITGHSPQEAKTIINHYLAHTGVRAARAMRMRATHEEGL